MKPNLFANLTPTISGNAKLREPQILGYEAISQYFQKAGVDREVGVVLPVGCGKSGLIAISPFAVRSRRTLVIAPGLNIAEQLLADLDPTNSKFFYKKCAVLTSPPFPEPAEIRGSSTNQADLDAADIVVTNIHQLQGTANKWLTALPADYFDLILVDEGHHNVAESWEVLRQRFPKARIVNFSATPARADGQLMAGEIIYSYPIFKAIAAGFVKQLKGVVLNPATLKYVRHQDGNEIEVTLDEVKKLGEDDADFRRSIVSSKETLTTIVDCSIRELMGLRAENSDKRHKIIASALNYAHCIQIVAAYQARGLRAAYIHSKENGPTNKKVLDQLERHDLDVIVQVRKLGEGFDHPYLSVAAVCSIFSNLSPFVQFVGRIMRAIAQNESSNRLNRGVVVFHAGANIARRWSDFQTYSKADQEYFEQLLPLEEVNFKDVTEVEIQPVPPEKYVNPVQIRNQTAVAVLEIPLIQDDEDAQKAIELLARKGYTPDQVKEAMLEAVPTTKQKVRLASKVSLDALIRNEVGRILRERGVNPKGMSLDKSKPPRENFVYLKSLIDTRINTLVGRKPKERAEFTQQQLDTAQSQLDNIAASVVEEVFDGKA
jgi:superfamily II DNA or RNA helicase